MAGIEINRRLVLSAGLLAGAGIVLSGCGQGNEIHLDVPDSTSFRYFSPNQVAILTDVADLMIPRTETVGAADTQTILYLDQLMQTWASEATKREFDGFIESLDALALANHAAGYLGLNNTVRRDFLQQIDAANFSETPKTASVPSYRRVKWLIFHIHYTSEAANPDFVLIPGQYQGDVSETEYLALVEDNRY